MPLPFIWPYETSNDEGGEGVDSSVTKFASFYNWMKKFQFIAKNMFKKEIFDSLIIVKMNVRFIFDSSTYIVTIRLVFGAYAY